MEHRNFLKDVYDDFFGIEKIEKENEKLRQELNIIEDYPSIEINQIRKDLLQESEEHTKQEKDNKMIMCFEKIDKLYLSEESKQTLKKIIEYFRKYNEGYEKQYISFNMCIYSENSEVVDEVINIIKDFGKYFSYVKNPNIIQKSFYDIEKVENIIEIYDNENGIIVLSDFEGFITQDQIFKDRIWHKIEEKNSNKQNFLTILVAKSKEIVNQSFEKNKEIKEKLFGFEIYGIKPETQEVYQEILKKLTQMSQISEDFSVRLLDYIIATYPKTTLPYPEYRDKLCENILFNKKDIITPNDIPEYEKEKSIEEIFEDLNSLVGLTKVKRVLQDLVNLIELKNKTNGNLKIKNTNLHMVFLGNPGTGKTTVARIISQILYNLNYIKQNKLIEVSSKDLVAQYVGQTAPKTMEVIEKAMGGVLFIDEAYSLAVEQGNSYNAEAIATLIQAMENYRDDFVVIFAGYTKEMQNFLNSNSGIVSRIGYTLEFEDYTEDELIQIFKSMITKAGFDIKEEALEEASKIISEYKNSENFGNARFIRNLYEKTIIKHASNTKGKKSNKILKTIQKEDISVENLLK